ncbi:MAG: CUAEP/CCAEP-tail radical SAM (seleno)protein [Betaproteobacteria bacterium]
MKALLIGTYEMGRQPFGLASPAAWLRDAGWTVSCLDLSRERFDPVLAAHADVVGVYLPMHTATRLAAPVVAAVRGARPDARLCAFGLYAPLNADWLRSLGVDAVFGGEFEADLVEWAGNPAGYVPGTTEPATLPRLRFLVPDRTTLPPPAQYATLQLPDGTRRHVGYVEASRGCRHLCRHCPVVNVYGGQFRIVQPEVVLADIAQQVEAGARHITFGDPDFLNGPAHALRIVEALHAAHATVSYDVTVKVEHLLRHRDLLPRLRGTGCLFITSAVESIDDAVLERLDKGHTRQGFFDALEACRAAGVMLAPTFVAFHPWTTLESYCELLDTLDVLDLVEQVAPIQLAIRLLVPRGSRLLELEDMRRVLGDFDPATLTWRWTHPDPRVDDLQRELADLVGVHRAGARGVLFDEIRRRAYDRAGRRDVASKPVRDRATVPYLNEPWYC